MDPTTFRIFSGVTEALPTDINEVILSFTASNNPAFGTQQAVLNWSTHEAFSITLNNGIGSVSNSSTLSVRHGNNQTITYTLTATAGGSTFSASVNVRFGYCETTYECVRYSRGGFCFEEAYVTRCYS